MCTIWYRSQKSGSSEFKCGFIRGLLCLDRGMLICYLNFITLCIFILLSCASLSILSAVAIEFHGVHGINKVFLMLSYLILCLYKDTNEFSIR